MDDTGSNAMEVVAAAKRPIVYGILDFLGGLPLFVTAPLYRHWHMRRAREQVIVAYVPMHGVRTIYATIGDVFAWLSAAGLLVLVGMAVAGARRGGETGLGS
jgi:hypothetical protein